MRNRSEKQMKRARGAVTSLVTSTVKEIVRLSRAFRSRGKDFAFSSFPELDKAVDSLLVTLSDDILADTLEKMKLALEEADMEDEYSNVSTDVQEDNRFGMIPIERIDSHSSHLKWFVEGMIAVCFANGIADRFIAPYVIRYIGNPMLMKEWRDAVKAGEEYAATIIREGGPHYGSGVQRNPIDGLTLTEETMISSGYQRGVIRVYRREGAVGYRVHRGSDYDCPSCDELCVGVHPVTEIVLPNHPRCQCWTTPVFYNEEME